MADFLLQSVYQFALPLLLNSDVNIKSVESWIADCHMRSCAALEQCKVIWKNFVMWSSWPPQTHTFINFFILLNRHYIYKILVNNNYTVKKSIPSSHRHNNYTPCWTKECEELLKEYERDGNEINADKLIALLDEERRNRWIQAMNEMEFTHLSRKSWSLLRKLEAAQTSWKASKVSPNSISAILHKTANIKTQKTREDEDES